MAGRGGPSTVTGTTVCITTSNCGPKRTNVGGRGSSNAASRNEQLPDAAGAFRHEIGHTKRGLPHQGRSAPGGKPIHAPQLFAKSGRTITSRPLQKALTQERARPPNWGKNDLHQRPTQPCHPWGGSAESWADFMQHERDALPVRDGKRRWALVSLQAQTGPDEARPCPEPTQPLSRRFFYHT